MSFLLNYNYTFDFTPPGLGASPLRIAAGITSVDPDNNEETEETYYYDGGGAAEIDVTGFMMSYGFEGHRNYGDPAQDYIFGLANKTGPARKGVFKVTEPNGDTWEGPATISEIKLPGGDANSKGEVSFTISFDGAPVFTENTLNPYPTLSPPSGVSTSALTANGVTVAFDTVSASKPLTYVVTGNGVEIGTGTTSPIVVTGLTASTEYVIGVKAQYTEKPEIESPLSTTVTVTTLAE